MIARIWRGHPPAAKAGAYLEYLNKTGIPDYTSLPGNRGVRVLLHVDDERAEFLLMSTWDSMEAIREFTGNDVDKAVYYPEDGDYLLEFEPNVRHYEVVVDLTQ